MESDDLADMLSNPQHLAHTTGTLTCPALSAQPMTITDGTFNLFVVDESDVDERNMNYRMTLNSTEGKKYYLTGQKIITRTSPINLWSRPTRSTPNSATRRKRMRRRSAKQR